MERQERPLATSMTAVQTLDGPTITFGPVFKYDDLYLAALPTAISCTQMFVHLTLEIWGFKRAIPEVERIAVKLVGGAVASTGIPDERPWWYETTKLNLLVLRLRQTDLMIHVEVWDSSDEPPPGAAPVGYQAGYFLHDGGKVVWVRVPVSLDEPEPLPRRKPTYSAPREPLGSSDVALMTRVRDRLKDI